MKNLKRIISFMFVPVLSCSMFVGCGEKKEEIPSMELEREKWEIEVHPGYFGRASFEFGYDRIPSIPITSFISESEIEYVKEPIIYANRADFDKVLITYPYCYTADIGEWRYWPEFKSFYYNSKGKRIESVYYAACRNCERYVGEEKGFENIKNDTSNRAWEDAYMFARPIEKDSLYRVSVEIYDDKDLYEKDDFFESPNLEGYFTTYIIVKGEER